MSMSATDVMARLFDLSGIPAYRLKFDILPPAREKVRKGFTYEANMKQGRPPTAQRYEDDIETLCADPTGWRIALYPGNYGVACLDFDMGEDHSTELLSILPPLFRTQSRSAYDDSRDTRAGHAWYRAPSKSAHLSGFTRLRGVFDRNAAVIDVLYTQLVFVPAQEFLHLLDGLIDWGQLPTDHQRARSFPYPVKMINAERPGNRDSVFFSSLAQQAWHTPPDLIDRIVWHRVLSGIGYFDDHPEEEFERQFEKAVSQSPMHDSVEQPYTSAGLETVLGQLGWAWRYNTRTGRAEFHRDRDSRYHSLAHKEPQLEFQDTVRQKFKTPAGKNSTKPWDPIANWSQVENWIASYSRRIDRFDPLGEHIKAWQDAEPLSDEVSLILSLMRAAPADDQDDTLRRCILNVEKNMLLAFYTRIITSQHDGIPDDVHFPYLPTFVGPRGCGKTRFCKSLSHGFHTDTVRFDDPPKVYGETATVKTVLEFAELSEQMGRPGSQIRGTAKNYIDKTRFDYRDAYGHYSTEHHLAGVLVGTTNKPISVNINDGLWRRIIHLPVQADTDLGPNLRHWDHVCDDLLPRALSRAAQHHAAGMTPRVKEDVVIDWLHNYFGKWRLSETQLGWERIGDEFDDDMI